MCRISDIATEVTRALAVLALVFLGFSHQPVAFERYGASAAVSAAFSCGADITGDPRDTNGKTSSPCQACRVASAIDLPTPPWFAVPVRPSLGLAVRDLVGEAICIAPVRAGGGPRAPPTSA